MTTFKARPTVYKGTRMRSRLEAGFAAWLDRCGFRWDYEPCAFATETGQYLPDFRITDLRVSWRDEPVTAYIEVKPATFDAYDLLATQMEVIRASEPDVICIMQRDQTSAEKASSHRGLVGVLWTPSDRPGVVGWPFTTFRKALWAETGETPMLVLPVVTADCPWPDGYWNVAG